MPLGTYASSAAFLLLLSVALAANDVVITVRHPLPGDIFLTSGLRPDVEVAFFPGGAIAERLRRSLGHYELCVDFDSRGAAAHIGAVSINFLYDHRERKCSYPRYWLRGNKTNTYK